MSEREIYWLRSVAEKSAPEKLNAVLEQLIAEGEGTPVYDSLMEASPSCTCHDRYIDHAFDDDINQYVVPEHQGTAHDERNL